MLSLMVFSCDCSLVCDSGVSGGGSVVVFLVHSLVLVVFLVPFSSASTFYYCFAAVRIVCPLRAACSAYAAGFSFSDMFWISFSMS